MKSLKNGKRGWTPKKKAQTALLKLSPKKRVVVDKGSKGGSEISGKGSHQQMKEKTIGHKSCSYREKVSKKKRSGGTLKRDSKRLGAQQKGTKPDAWRM